MPDEHRSERRCWARRVRPQQIRALYRGESRGLLDPDLALEVGWALWERARDVVEVSTAVWSGDVPCPACAGRARRQRRRTDGPSPSGTAVRCEGCGFEATWADVREALRHHPLCLDCREPLSWHYEAERLACDRCRESTPWRVWRRRLRGRRRLPCPRCRRVLAAPRPDAAAETLPIPSPRPPGPDLVRCETCGWQQRWSRFSKRWKGEGLVTGAGLPACEDFVRQWPHAGNASQCMILIDGFVHALHDGPLAPLLVEGDRESVLALLDKIASQ